MKAYYIEPLMSARLPQVLTVQRGATTIMPHGFTKLHKTDEMMICGRPNSLASVTAMKTGKVTLVF